MSRAGACGRINLGRVLALRSAALSGPVGRAALPAIGGPVVRAGEAHPQQRRSSRTCARPRRSVVDAIRRIVP